MDGVAAGGEELNVSKCLPLLVRERKLTPTCGVFSPPIGDATAPSYPQA